MCTATTLSKRPQGGREDRLERREWHARGEEPGKREGARKRVCGAGRRRAQGWPKATARGHLGALSWPPIGPLLTAARGRPRRLQAKVGQACSWSCCCCCPRRRHNQRWQGGATGACCLAACPARQQPAGTRARGFNRPRRRLCLCSCCCGGQARLAAASFWRRACAGRHGRAFRHVVGAAVVAAIPAARGSEPVAPRQRGEAETEAEGGGRASELMA